MSTGHPEAYDLSESRQANIIVCAALTWLISAVVVASRMYLRGVLMKLVGPEDWVILAALVFSLAQSIGFIVMAAFGVGKHDIAIPDENFPIMFEASWFTILAYTCSLTLSKISVVLLYLRTLTFDWTRKVLLGFMVVVTLSGGLNLILDFTACIPLNAFWDRSVRATYCHSAEVFYALTAVQIATDFLIFLLPLPIIWSLRAPKDQKIVLSVVFSFGFFICIVSIIRIVLLATTPDGPDFSYSGAETTYWSLIEINTAIVCASVMTLKPLFNSMFAQSTRQATSKPNGADPGHYHDQRTPRHDAGSRPSRKAPPPFQTRQSWLSAQLAKLDRPPQTATEARSGAGAGADEEASLRRAEAGMAGLRSDTELRPWPPGDGRERLSNNSSITTPVERKPDGGPLG